MFFSLLEQSLNYIRRVILPAAAAPWKNKTNPNRAQTPVPCEVITSTWIKCIMTTLAANTAGESPSSHWTLDSGELNHLSDESFGSVVTQMNTEWSIDAKWRKNTTYSETMSQFITALTAKKKGKKTTMTSWAVLETALVHCSCQRASPKMTFPWCPLKVPFSSLVQPQWGQMSTLLTRRHSVLASKP